MPLPSIVKVTNLDNGKVLSFVRVNDKGPFARNRIIDLSKEAAKQLGFVNKGVAKVRVEILEDESRKFANDLVKSNKNAKAAVVQEVKKKDLSVNSNKSLKSNNKIIKDNVDVELDENFVLKNNEILLYKLEHFQITGMPNH